MSIDKTIPGKDVASALMCAKVRLLTTASDGGRHGRTAAFTQAPFWEPTCRDRARDRRLGIEPRRALPQHFSPMHTGDMDRVLERVRRERGLGEVRRTWGVGYRALHAEFSGSSVMR